LCGSLTTMFANVLESSHDGCFTVFIKIKFPRFYSLTLANRTFCTLFFIQSSSESSKTPYRFAPLNISVVLLLILCMALSYVGISFIVLSVIVLSVIVVIVLSVIILSVIIEDWFTILLNNVSISHFNIAMTDMTLSSFISAPRLGHLERAICICYNPHKKRNMYFRTGDPSFSNLPDHKYYWQITVYVKTMKKVQTCTRTISAMCYILAFCWCKFDSLHHILYDFYRDSTPHKPNTDRLLNLEAGNRINCDLWSKVCVCLHVCWANKKLILALI